MYNKLAINMINDFFFHTIWASKKILRGELWTAKMCIDAYLKKYLLKITEMYSLSKYHVYRLASQTAEMKGYKYPKEAENYTKILLEETR